MSVSVTIQFPDRFHEILEALAKAEGQTVEEYITDTLIGFMDTDLDGRIGPVFGLTEPNQRRARLEAMLAEAPA